MLAQIPFHTQTGRKYRLEFVVRGDELLLSIDGLPALSARDASFRYGMAGVRMGSAGRMLVHRLAVEDLA